jgi:hypothetical protein
MCQAKGLLCCTFVPFSWNHYLLHIVLNRNFCFRLSNPFSIFLFFYFYWKHSDDIPRLAEDGKFNLRLFWWVPPFLPLGRKFTMVSIYVLSCLVYLYSIITCSWLLHFNCSYYRGIRVHCTLWDDFALKMQQFLDTRDQSLPVVIIIQLCKLKKYLGKKKQCPFNLLFEF